MIQLRRLRQSFPFVAGVVRNVHMLLVVALVAAPVLWHVSPHYSMACVAVWVGVFCFYVDRKHLNYTLITPLMGLAEMMILSHGVGPALRVFGGEAETSYGLLYSQIAGVVGALSLILGYWLVMRRAPAFVLPPPGLERSQLFERPLTLVGWVLLAHEFMRVATGVLSGSMDRGYGGDFITERPFGLWTTFGILLQIQALGFLLVPLCWRRSQLVGRVALLGILGAIFVLHFAAASRGAVVFPLFLMLIGNFLFAIRPRRVEGVMIVGLLAITPILILMGNFRSTEEFRESSLHDVAGRLATLQFADHATEKNQESSIALVGRSFIGTVDFLVFEMTPDVIPYVQLEGLDSVVWVLVPYIVYRNRPILQDGKFIAERYLGHELVRTSIGITLTADLYRRFGWPAVPVGLFLYGLIYGAIFRWVYRIYFLKNALLGFLMLGVLMNFFIGWNFHSVPNVVHGWVYSTFCKHFMVMFIGYCLLRLVLKLPASRGAAFMLHWYGSERRWHARVR